MFSFFFFFWGGGGFVSFSRRGGVGVCFDRIGSDFSLIGFLGCVLVFVDDDRSTLFLTSEPPQQLSTAPIVSMCVWLWISFLLNLHNAQNLIVYASSPARLVPKFRKTRFFKNATHEFDRSIDIDSSSRIEQ